jgi:predicted Zn-dependent protease
MTTTWQGHYLDGRTAIRHPATVRLGTEGLEVSTPAGSARLWPYPELRQTQGFYEGEAVRLERRGQPTETLVVDDPGFLSSLRDAAPELGARFHDPRLRGRRLGLTAMAVVAVVGLVAALYAWGIPALAGAVAARVPPAWEAALGQAALDSLAPAARRCEEPESQAVLDRLVARLAAAGGPPGRVRLHVVDAPAVNAHALPGGHIVIFEPLLARMRSPEELAGVLAHELQHLARRHALQMVIQHASTGLLLAAVTGDMTGPVLYGLEAARVAADRSYSRQAEEEADEEGLEQVIAARIDPRGTIAFHEAMLEGELRVPGALRYLSTHPATSERIARLRAIAARAAVAPEPAMSAGEWERVKGMCRSPRR